MDFFLFLELPFYINLSRCLLFWRSEILHRNSLDVRLEKTLRGLHPDPDHFENGPLIVPGSHPSMVKTQDESWALGK